MLWYPATHPQPETANKLFQNRAQDVHIKLGKFISPSPYIPDLSIPKDQEAFNPRESASPAAGQAENRQRAALTSRACPAHTSYLTAPCITQASSSGPFPLGSPLPALGLRLLLSARPLIPAAAGQQGISSRRSSARMAPGQGNQLRAGAASSLCQGSEGFPGCGERRMLPGR